MAALDVISVHVSAKVLADQPDFHSSNWLIANITDAFSHWCVPIFAMISGAFLLGKDSSSGLLEFYKKRLPKILIPLSFWTLFYLAFQSIETHQIHPGNALRNIFSGLPYYHLWYLYMFVGLILSTPFLRQIIKTNSLATIRGFAIACLAIAAIEAPWTFHFFLPTFLPFVGYYVAGYYLANTPPFFSKRLLSIGFMACGLTIAIETRAFIPKLGTQAYELVYGYFNPLLIIMSLCIFALFLQIRSLSPRVVAVLRHVAPNTLGIYVMHPFWLSMLNKMGITGTFWHPMAGIPVTAISAFMLSLLSSALFAKIPFLRKTVC